MNSSWHCSPFAKDPREDHREILREEKAKNAAHEVLKFLISFYRNKEGPSYSITDNDFGKLWDISIYKDKRVGSYDFELILSYLQLDSNFKEEILVEFSIFIQGADLLAKTKWFFGSLVSILKGIPIEIYSWQIRNKVSNDKKAHIISKTVLQDSQVECQMASPFPGVKVTPENIEISTSKQSYLASMELLPVNILIEKELVTPVFSTF